jgi:phage recombination protein Bet
MASKNNNAVAVSGPRLPMPVEPYDLGEGRMLDAGMWKVLSEATYPNARTPQAIMMALDYCKVRKLDPFKKPVHIVPMWNSAAGREIETVWPGINEVQITAARTGGWAGMDAPEWGPDVTRTFKGRVKVENQWADKEVTLTFPEWCSVTVYRMIGNHRCPFSEPVYWLEAYARLGRNNELPNEMWIKRTRGQLHKVAKAAALRAAFPEEGDYTAEEMYGKEIGEVEGVVIDRAVIKEVEEQPPLGSQSKAELPKQDKVDAETGEVTEVVKPVAFEIDAATATSQNWILFGQKMIAAVTGSKSKTEADEWLKVNHANLVAMKDSPTMVKEVLVDGGKSTEKRNVTYIKLKAAIGKAYDLLPDVEEADGELLEALKHKEETDAEKTEA